MSEFNHLGEPIVPPSPVKQRVWPLYVLVITVAIALALFVTYLAYSNPVEDSVDCTDAMNQSFINGTQYGYLNGIYDTSEMVLTQGILPVFNEEGEIQYLNLTGVSEE